MAIVPQSVSLTLRKCLHCGGEIVNEEVRSEPLVVKEGMTFGPGPSLSPEERRRNFGLGPSASGLKFGPKPQGTIQGFRHYCKDCGRDE